MGGKKEEKIHKKCKHINACEAGRYMEEETGGIYAHIICYECSTLWKEEITEGWEGYTRCSIDRV